MIPRDLLHTIIFTFNEILNKNFSLYTKVVGNGILF
jgi:hypothetical protein